jgi:hypothetical protein
MLQEARNLENVDPVQANRLREDAQQRLQRLQTAVEDVDDAIGFWKQELTQAQKDAAWGVLVAGAEAASHTAIAVDNSIDLAVKLAGADANPQVRAILEAKGWSYTAVSAIQKVGQGGSVMDPTVEGTWDATIEVASNIDNPETKMLANSVKALRAADDGDTDEMVSAAAGVAEGVAVHFELTPAARAASAASSAHGAATEIEKAGQSLNDAMGFLEFSAQLDKAEEQANSKAAENQARQDMLTKVGLDYPESYTPVQNASFGDFSVAQRILAQFGLEVDSVNAAAATMGLPNPRIEAMSPVEMGEMLQRINDQVASMNQTASANYSSFMDQDQMIAQEQALVTQLQALRDQIVDSMNAKKSADRSHADGEHCPDGVFRCPNGFPWPECTHKEKYDCPPPEYADEAAAYKSNKDPED